MNNSINVLLLNEIKNIAKEKNIEQEKIKEFLVEAIKRIFNKVTYEDNINVAIDLNSGQMITNLVYEVVALDYLEFDEALHIAINDPRIKDLNLQIGDKYEEHFDLSKKFNQQQVQQIMQYFKQRITEISNQRVYESWLPMQNEIILAEIEKEDKKSNFYTINLEDQYDKMGQHLEPTLGFLGNKELNQYEVLDVRKKYPFVVLEVKEQSKFCPVILSRASEKLVEHFLTMEVPEIDDGTIKIVKSARQAGVKTKVLVSSKTLPIEPASVCVGSRGERVKNVSNQLNGEKIEIYNYYEDPIVLLSEIVTKTDLIKLGIKEEDKTAVLVVEEDQIYKIIGKKGCNVKLASILSGYSISIIGPKDEEEYDDYEFININSEAFRQRKIQAKNSSTNTMNTETVLPVFDDEIEEMINEFDENELNDVFKDEVEQILNFNNEKEKL